VLGGALLEIETAAENAYIAGYIKDKYSTLLIFVVLFFIFK
jgi:hypothetical protein